MLHRRLLVPLALALPITALAGPMSGYVVVGEMGADFTDPSGFGTSGFFATSTDSGIIGTDIECLLSDPWVWGDFSDVDRTLTIGVDASFASGFAFNGLRFTFTDATAPSIAGATLVSTTIPAFTSDRLTSNDDTVAFNFVGLGAAGTVTVELPDNPPTLPPEPTVEQLGTCPGGVGLSFTNFTPNGQIAVVMGNPSGTSLVPSGSCRGLLMPVSRPSLVALVQAEADGSYARDVVLPARLCGKRLVAIDMATCDRADAIEL